MAGEVISRLVVVVAAVVVRVKPFVGSPVVVVSSRTGGCSGTNKSGIRPNFNPAMTTTNAQNNIR